MNVRTTIRGDVSLKNTSVNLMVALEEKPEKSVEYVCTRPTLPSLKPCC